MKNVLVVVIDVSMETAKLAHHRFFPSISYIVREGPDINYKGSYRGTTEREMGGGGGQVKLFQHKKGE